MGSDDCGNVTYFLPACYHLLSQTGSEVIPVFVSPTMDTLLAIFFPSSPFLIDPPSIAASTTSHRPATQQAVSCGNFDIRHAVFRDFLLYLQKKC